MQDSKKIILSGMRPTGKLHIGHYVGALENWVTLQNDYQNYHLIADYHTLTTNLDTSNIFDDSIDMAIDWIASGIDPVKSPIFRQSKIKEHTELFLIFSMLITKARLERNPTLKEQIKDMNISSIIYGHLGYPVLQAADILLYKGNMVPVGEDQDRRALLERLDAAGHHRRRRKEPVPALDVAAVAQEPPDERRAEVQRLGHAHQPRPGADDGGDVHQRGVVGDDHQRPVGHGLGEPARVPIDEAKDAHIGVEGDPALAQPFAASLGLLGGSAFRQA